MDPDEEEEDELLVEGRKNMKTYSRFKRPKLEGFSNDDEEDNDISPIAIFPDLPSVDTESLSRLKPGSWLNDTLIDFFLAYCLRKLPLLTRKRFHLFNSYFYTKLNQIRDDKKKVSDLILNWNRREKVLEKDFIVIPTCLSQHWVLVVVCYAHKIPLTLSDNASNTSAMKELATILIFDSLGFGYLSRFTYLIRTFLDIRWKYERPKERTPDFYSKILLKDKSAKVPLQPNKNDCGVYMLHYFEKFVQDPTMNFLKLHNDGDLKQEWNLKPKRKREVIRQIIQSHISDKIESTSSGRELVEVE